MILDEAHTWFLENSKQLPGGELQIRLVEGIKGTKRLPVQIGEDILGPYYPVTVEQNSRVVDVRFDRALAVFTYNESFDGKDLGLETVGSSVLRKVNSSSFRNYLGATTTVLETGEKPLNEYLLWTEDQVFQVLATGEPVVTLSAEAPDLSLERVETWSAN